MASAIEEALYGSEWAERVSPTGEVGEHCILELSLTEGVVRLRLAPWDLRFAGWTTATFRNAYLGPFVQTASEADELQMPWGIIGFHSHEEKDGRWQFNLNCNWVRWSWSSEWPDIERSRA